MENQEWFPQRIDAKHLRVVDDQSAVFQHEFLFEQEQATITRRPLFVWKTFGKRRFFGVLFLLSACLAILIARAAWVQLGQGTVYQALANANRLRSIPLWPRRGLVLDRRSNVLAENVSRFQVTLTPSLLPIQLEKREEEIGRVARLLGMTMQSIRDLVNATGTARYETLLVADQLPYEQAMLFAIAAPDLPGFRMEAHPKRLYPFSAQTQSLSHILGYMGKLSPEEYAKYRALGYLSVDELGKTGVEKIYEKELRGELGQQETEVDAHGRIKGFVGDKPAIDGQNLVLTLDVELQRRAEQTLRDELILAGVKRGAVVAMDPRDGSILAMVSLPAYNDNDFSGGVSSTVYSALLQDPDQPLFPRAIAGTYPSGSTVKIVISAAALAEGVITPNTTIFSVGGLSIGPWFFPDWKAGGHGPTNVRGAIAWSVNTFFYTIGGGYESFVGLGVDRLSEWMRRFGMGTKTGIDLPSEAEGFVPSKEWKEQTQGERWFVGDTYNLSIGQGDLLVTPLQVALYTAAIANGGTLLRPHVVKRDQENTRVQQITEPAFIGVVRSGMRENVTYGSGRSLSDLPFAAAGKTGTAQWHREKNNHAWFTSFAPFEKPEIVVTVLLEEGGEGSSVAVPVAKRILRAWWDLRTVRGGTF